MTQKRLKKLGFNYFIIIILFLVISCSSYVKGKWYIESITITIIPEIGKNIELSSLIEQKLKRYFPVILEKGDLIYIEKEKVTINNQDSYHYYLSDSLFFIQREDVVYGLNVYLSKSKLFLIKELPQGTIKYTLSKVK